jgi:hypothetical protein
MKIIYIIYTAEMSVEDEDIALYYHDEPCSHWWRYMQNGKTAVYDGNKFDKLPRKHTKSDGDYMALDFFTLSP